MPIDKEKISNTAQKYLQKGQYDKAIREFHKIVDSDPKDMRIWKKIGDIQVRAGDTRGAITTYLRLSDDFFSQGHYSKALAILRQIQTLDATIEEVYLKLAEVYAATNFLPDAIYQLDKLAKLQENSGNIESMIQTLQRMADLDGSQWTYRAHLAETLSRLGRKSEAAAELRKVAMLLRDQKDMTDFIRVAERLMFHDPDDVDNALHLAEAYLETRTPEEKVKQVLKHLLRFLQNNPSDIRLLQLLARMFLYLKKKESAVNVYRELSRIYREKGQFSESEAVLERILEIFPDDEETLIALNRKQPEPPKKITSARLGGRSMDYSEPIEEISLDEIEEIDDIDLVEDDIVLTGDDHKHFEEAAAFFKFSLYDQALALIEKISARQSLDVLELEKNLYMRMGKKEEALALMEKLAGAWEKTTPEKALEIAKEILLVEPQSSLAERILKAAPKPSPQAVEDDLFNILREIESIESDIVTDSQVLENPLTFDENVLHSDEEVENALRIREKELPVVHEISEEDLDLSEMLSSLRSLEGEENSELFPEIESSVTDPLPFSGNQFQDKLNQLDELEALKEASQSFIRIQELSQEEIRLADMISLQGDPFPDSPDGNFELTPPPVEPESVESESFMLDSEDGVLHEPDPDSGKRLSNPARQHRETFEPTMDHLMELLTLDDQIASALSPEEPAAETPDVPLPEEVEEAFQEVAFFLETELFDEAIDILEEIMIRHPLPAVREKLRLVRAAANPEAEPADEPAAGPAPVEPPADEPADEPAAGPAPVEPPDEFPTVNSQSTFDAPFVEESLPGPATFEPLPFSSELEDISLDFDDEVVTNLSGLNINELDQDHGHSSSASPSSAAVRLETDIPEGDALTHFELGVAYKEMGLFDQAKEEFRMAMEEPRLQIKAHMMIARCLMDLGRFAEAASEYKKSLHCETISKDEEMDLYFELGQLYESLKDLPEAQYFYRKVLMWDPSYRNVEQILNRLKPIEG